MRALKILIVFAVFTIASMTALPEADAQKRKGSWGRGYKGEYQGKYDPQTVTIVKGIVETIEQMPPATGTSIGIRSYPLYPPIPHHFSPVPTTAELNCRQTALRRTLGLDVAKLNQPKPLNSHQSKPSARLLRT